MEREELLMHLKSAYRQGAKASVIANLRGMFAKNFKGIATVNELQNNDFAATLHLRQGDLTECQILFAQCLALCVRWQESPFPDDGVADSLFTTAQWAISASLQAPLQKYRKAQSDRRKCNGKIGNEEKTRIQRQYAERLRDGQKYGAIKALASTHNVSESAIKNIVRELN